MTLAEYMQLTQTKDQQLAEMLGKDRSSVSRWRTGKTKPDFDALVAIEKLTKGLVTASDFATPMAAE